VEIISVKSDTTTAMEPQQKQLQKGEQVSSSCGLAGLSVISDFCVLSLSSLQISVQGIEQSSKIYRLKSIQKNNFISAKIQNYCKDLKGCKAAANAVVHEN